MGRWLSLPSTSYQKAWQAHTSPYGTETSLRLESMPVIQILRLVIASSLLRVWWWMMDPLTQSTTFIGNPSLESLVNFWNVYDKKSAVIIYFPWIYYKSSESSNVSRINSKCPSGSTTQLYEYANNEYRIKEKIPLSKLITTMVLFDIVYGSYNMVHRFEWIAENLIYVLSRAK